MAHASTGLFSSLPLSVRVTFSYRGGDYRVDDLRLVEKRPPPSDPILEDGAVRAGFWVEVRDRQGRMRYRRIMHDPIGLGVEVHGEPDDDRVGTSHRVQVDDPQATVFAVVPNLPEGGTVRLVSSPPPPAPPGSPAREVASAELPGSSDFPPVA